jgi:hypothetical protein
MELATLCVFAVAHLVVYGHVTTFWRTVARVLGYVHPLTVSAAATSIGAAAGCVAVIALRFVPIPRVAWGVFLAGMVMSFAAVNSPFDRPVKLVAMALWPEASSFSFRAEFEQTALAHRFIAASIPQKVVRFWYAPPTRVSPPFRSISSTFLWEYVLINEDFPHITAKVAKTIQPGSRLVLLMRTPSEEQEARDALRPFGLDFTVVEKRGFGTSDRPFIVLVGDFVQVRVAGHCVDSGTSSV